MIRTCIREYGNKIVKYLCAEVRGEYLESIHGYRFTSVADIEELIRISGLHLDVRLDFRSGYAYLVRSTPPSLSSRVISTAIVGEMFLLDLATQEFKAVSSSHFEMHYRVLDKI